MLVYIRGSPVVIGAVYIPPRNSVFAREYSLVLSELVEAIVNVMMGCRGSPQLLIMCDFNAHTGGL